MKARNKNILPQKGFTLIELIVVLAIIGVIIGGITTWRGQQTKAKEETLRQQEAEAAAILKAQRAEAKEAEMLAQRVKEAVALLDLYGTAIGGLAIKADEAVEALQKEASSPAAQQVRRQNSTLAARVMAQQVSATYENWKNLLERMEEQLEDAKAYERLGQLSRFTHELEEGVQKAALQGVVKACEDTREAFNRYRFRFRTDVEEQLEQLKGCAATVLPNAAALTDARKQLEALKL